MDNNPAWRPHERHIVTDIPKNLDGFVLPADAIHVSSWHTERDGKGRPTQVHLYFELVKLPPEILLEHIRVTGEITDCILRLKSRDACDALITALQNHRDEVFPEGE